MASRALRFSSTLALVTALSHPSAAIAAPSDPNDVNRTDHWRGAGWYAEGIWHGKKSAYYGPFSSASACAPYRAYLDNQQEVARGSDLEADMRCIYESGYVKFEKSNCFLTTACTLHAGLPDDCEELTVLRNFRDGYIARLPGGSALISEYYRIAPGIVREIMGASDRDVVLPWIFQHVRASVDSIRADQPTPALRRYRTMVQSLHRRYGVPRERSVSATVG